MCILSFLPPGVAVDEDGLLNGGINNPDGHGWAIVTGGTIVTGKSLDVVEALEGFTAARNQHSEGPALFHSRWATHGRVNLDNAHPFAVGGSARTVVAHNGILPDAAHPDKGDDRSDTRKFADEILPTRFRRLDRNGVQRALSQWCGKFNKLVILTVDTRYRENAYLVNEEAGEWDVSTGIWHSNTDYRDTRGRWSHGTAAYTSETALWDNPSLWGEDCLMCGWEAVDERGYCEVCGFCQDCADHVRDCSCWQRRAVALDQWDRVLE